MELVLLPRQRNSVALTFLAFLVVKLRSYQGFLGQSWYCYWYYLNLNPTNVDLVFKYFDHPKPMDPLSLKLAM